MKTEMTKDRATPQGIQASKKLLDCDIYWQ